MSATPRRFRLNAPGDFFVEDGMCIACGAPEHEAPDLMAHADDENGHYHCYFRRQPKSPLEVEQAVRAVCISCCEAVQYGGADRKILALLGRDHQKGTDPRTA